MTSVCEVVIDDNRCMLLEQQYLAAEGSVIWDCARVLISYIASKSDSVLGKRVVELGSGTGAVGIALYLLGAASVALSDRPSQMALIHRNIELNKNVNRSSDLFTFNFSWCDEAGDDSNIEEMRLLLQHTQTCDWVICSGM